MEKKKSENSLRTHAMTSSRVTHILGVPEEERGRKFIKEIMAKTFPNLEKEKDMEIKEVQRVPK